MAKTYLNISVEQKSPALTNAKNVTVTAFDGPNPAGNVGAVSYTHLDVYKRQCHDLDGGGLG